MRDAHCSFRSQHGVVRSKTAKNRDELVDLMNRNYYSAKDTTWHWWTNNQIRHWLESRGIVTAPEAKREELESTIADKYYSLRDSAYTVSCFIHNRVP
jgi:hypothetical protein